MMCLSPCGLRPSAMPPGRTPSGRHAQTKATAKIKWMRANTFVTGRPPLNEPHTSKAAIAANPTMLPRMTALSAVEGSAFRDIQFRAAIPRRGLPHSRRYAISAAEASAGTAPAPKDCGAKIKPRPTRAM